MDKSNIQKAIFTGRTWRNTNTGAASAELAEEVAKLLDPSGKLQAGIPLCPPEGDTYNMVREK